MLVDDDGMSYSTTNYGAIVHYAQQTGTDQYGAIMGPTACGNPALGTYASNQPDRVSCDACRSTFHRAFGIAAPAPIITEISPTNHTNQQEMTR